MKNLERFFIFMVGLGVGGAIGYKLSSDHFKKIADEEIESVKDEFAKLYSTDNETEQKEENDSYIDMNKLIKEKNDKKEHKEIIKDYVQEEDEDEDPDYIVDIDNGDEQDDMAPYTIAPEEYGEMEGYDAKTLYYYADKVLAYENGDLVVDPVDIIGQVKLEGSFGEYSDDGVYVRNDKLRCDYEILLSLKTYEEDTGKLIEE